MNVIMYKYIKYKLAVITFILIGFGALYATPTQLKLKDTHVNIDSTGLDNEYVTVTKNVSNVGNSKEGVYSYRIIVALTNTKINSNKGVINLKRGETVVCSANDSYQLLTGEYFEVSVKKNHPKPVAPRVWHEPGKNNTVFENDEFRIFEERLAPGGVRALHSHLERVVVRLNNVQLTDPRFFPIGEEGKGIQVPNTVKFAPPMEHVVKNLGSIPLFNIVIEFKAPRY